MTVLEAKAGVVAVLDAETTALFEDSAETLFGEMRGAGRAAIVLLPWRDAPLQTMRADGEVRSFLCSKELLRNIRRLPRGQMCFRLLSAILDGELDVDRLLIRQLPFRGWRSNRAAPGPAAVIMAHRGSRRHLETALTFIQRARGQGIQCRVGLDVENVAAYRSLVRAHPSVEFLRFGVAPVGPYVVRQELANRSREARLIFHDSDDVSCADRFAVLHEEMRRTRCELVGCHQLVVDECLGHVTAARFPLDVSSALREVAVHALWHPTSMVQRKHFVRAGGFSMDRAFANDTQFLLRAYFSMHIRNADAFLYIRRRHAEAITVRPETALDCPERRQLAARWRADFEAVKNGTLALENSSLRPYPARRPYRAIPVAPHV